MEPSSAKLACSAILGIALSYSAEAGDDFRQVGVARIDITPGYAIRLTGYAVRKTESEGVTERLWAKALAIGSDRQGPAIIITVDNCGIPLEVREEVVVHLKQGHGIAPERV